MTRVPAGYRALQLPHARLVARADLADALREAMLEESETLHAWAARQPHARAMHGRGVAWAVMLPDGGGRAVVRHNRHGGLLAALTGDRFLPPTRAPHELAMALRLAERGVPTPEVLAYATYPVARSGVLMRVDVVTREVVYGRDLGAVLADREAPAAVRHDALDAAARLVAALAHAGARHLDLNVKNVLLAPGERGALRAWALDVDRVTFHRPDERLREVNLARLVRSARKWQRVGLAPVSEAEIARLAEVARAG